MILRKLDRWMGFVSERLGSLSVLPFCHVFFERYQFLYLLSSVFSICEMIKM